MAKTLKKTAKKPKAEYRRKVESDNATNRRRSREGRDIAADYPPAGPPRNSGNRRERSAGVAQKNLRPSGQRSKTAASVLLAAVYANRGGEI